MFQFNMQVKYVGEPEKMYEVYIYSTTIDDDRMIHCWVEDNIESYSEEVYGHWYLFEHAEDAMAFKLRWG